MSSLSVGYIIGGLSRQSINRPLARAVIRLAPENLTFVEIPIRNPPVYNRDFDDGYPPASVQELHRVRLRGMDRRPCRWGMGFRSEVP